MSTTYFDPSLNVNNVATDSQSGSLIFTGQVYAFPGVGGYAVEQGFQTIHRLAEQRINIFDTTSAAEVAINAEKFNNKIGIYKSWNQSAGAWDLNTSHLDFYDNSNNMLYKDDLSLNATDFVAAIPAVSNIISVGKFSTCYLDFAQYVATYFGLVLPTASNPYVSDASGVAKGFATLFRGDYMFDPSGGVFSNQELWNLIHGSGEFNATTKAGIDKLKGYLYINNITKLLRNAVDANPFGNRNPVSGKTAIDSHDRSNYGVTDGFMPDDLIFIPENGFSITLNLNIDYTTTINNYVSNNQGPGFSATFQSNQAAAWDASLNASGSASTPSIFNETTVTSTNLLSRTVTAPLLIRLIATNSPV